MNWTKNNEPIPAPVGYNVGDYFDASGEFLGSDSDGIAPVIEGVRWTCAGSVRGCCGITHRTLKAAMACCAKDQQGCAGQGGYSDRKPEVAK